jgi:hypothetical protein
MGMLQLWSMVSSSCRMTRNPDLTNLSNIFCCNCDQPCKGGKASSEILPSIANGVEADDASKESSDLCM